MKHTPMTEMDSSAPTLEIESGRVGFQYRIEEELEKVNIAVEEINQASKDAHEARNHFNGLFKKAKERLDKIYTANRKSIEIARPFYVAKEEALKAKDNFIDAAARYRACCVHFEEARENAATAEKAFLASFQMNSIERGNGNEGMQDPEVLVNLNKANEKVYATSRAKSDALHEQQRRMEILSNADHQVAVLAKDISKHIARAKSYFDARDSFQNMIDTELEKMREAFSRLEDSKSRYRATFSKIHVISAEFEQRLGNPEDGGKFTDLSKFEEVEDIDDLTAGALREFDEVTSAWSLSLSFSDYLIDFNLEESILSSPAQADSISTNSTLSSTDLNQEDPSVPPDSLEKSSSFENLAKFDELSLEPSENEAPEISKCSLSFQWMS